MTMQCDAERAEFSVPGLRPRRWLERLRWSNARHREMRSLERLDDRLLRDIGVTPADVRRELRRSIWSGPPA